MYIELNNYEVLISMENYKYIQDNLNNGKIVILDGANGSELEKRGARMDRAGWCGPASITHPNILEDIHKDYILAGARGWGAAITKDDKFLIVTNGNNDNISIIDTKKNAAIKSISVGRTPHTVRILE